MTSNSLRSARVRPASLLVAPVRATLVFTTFLLAAACTKPATPGKTTVPVTVTLAELGDAPYQVTANGIVEPLQSVAVQSQVGGVLTAVKFKEGDEVQAGQILFEIDPIPYRAALQQAQAVLARDQAQSANAQRDADRYAALAQRDFVTRSQADQAMSNATALKAVLDADKASVATAQFNLDNASIRAPVSGKTGALLVRQGNLVRSNATTALVQINQIHPILVRFAVPEKELQLVQQYSRSGAALRATARPAHDGVPVVGALSFVDNGVDTTTGTVTLKARFPNDDNRLWPGQFMPVTLDLFVQAGAVLVPSVAVQTGQDGLFVWIVDDAGKAQLRLVKVARAFGEKSVIASGLSAGERVVVDGQSRLTVGATADIKTVGAATKAPAAGAGKVDGRGARKAP
ncbi:MAG: efflux RND transporter periplasmic adaptor subunit [Gemmatimonadetes bacterium]|nr:efflux RND transporter periplasmic adaptor subunit [Gemmatimonadota bacterium]